MAVDDARKKKIVDRLFTTCGKQATHMPPLSHKAPTEEF
jgi:hypothetical protein